MRLWCAADLFFFMLYVLSSGREAKYPYRNDSLHFWHPIHLWYAREIQFDSNQVVDIAARGFGKSTWKTHADNLRQGLCDPNSTSCIFSHTREFASKHAAKNGDELRRNDLLKEIWIDRLHIDPRKEAATWSVSTGYEINRSSVRHEKSFEAHAFVTGLPAGSHYSRLYFDDIETEKNVTNAEQMEVVQERIISAQDLVESSAAPRYYTGTYYDPNGAMMWLQTDLGLRARVLPGEDLSRMIGAELGGPLGGTPVFFEREDLHKKLRDRGGANSPKARLSYARQIACDPMAGAATRLNSGLVRWYEDDPLQLAARPDFTLVACFDPSKGVEDPSFLFIWGLREDHGLYWIDGFRRRMVPGVRESELFKVCNEWARVGRLEQIRIENFGQSEVAERQETYNTERRLYTPIIQCKYSAPNIEDKRMRIYGRWEPALAAGRVFFPTRGILSQNDAGDRVNLVTYLLGDEMKFFPMCRHDDGLDAGSLIWEPEQIVGPMPWPTRRYEAPVASSSSPTGGTFMSGGI
jgi:hypothetical protein